MSDTMIFCVLKFYINRVDDSEIREILQQTLDLSNMYIIELTDLFNKEKMIIRRI